MTKKSQIYLTQNNYPSEDVAVHVSNASVKVYSRKRETIDEFESDADFSNPKYFDVPVWSYDHPLKVMPGISPENKTTQFSGGWGDEFDGNTVLVQIGEKKYVFIGNGMIYSFSIGISEVFENYVSMMGNSTVASAWIETDKNIYLLSVRQKLKRSDYQNAKQTNEDIDDPYDLYYMDARTKKPKLVGMKTKTIFKYVR